MPQDRKAARPQASPETLLAALAALAVPQDRKTARPQASPETLFAALAAQLSAVLQHRKEKPEPQEPQEEFLGRLTILRSCGLAAQRSCGIAKTGTTSLARNSSCGSCGSGYFLALRGLATPALSAPPALKVPEAPKA